MTPSEASQRLMIASVVGVAINGLATVAGYMIGAKYKHPVVGGLLGFFVVGPLINTPVIFAIGGEAMRVLEADRAARQPMQGASLPPRMP